MERRPDATVVVLEKEDDVARHQTGVFLPDPFIFPSSGWPVRRWGTGFGWPE
ncbi:hypothetical protein AB1399_01245 [Hydrogenibacillus schlegelii]|uniref:hypothetical protein n=1 Tax=Hydrogenibacillus schlegelii TaxID=1484 RepID=UPI00349FD2BF